MTASDCGFQFPSNSLSTLEEQDTLFQALVEGHGLRCENNCCYPNIEPAQPEPDIETEMRKLDTKPGYELLVAKSEGPSPSLTFLHLSFAFLHLPSLVFRDSPV